MVMKTALKRTHRKTFAADICDKTSLDVAINACKYD